VVTGPAPAAGHDQQIDQWHHGPRRNQPSSVPVTAAEWLDRLDQAHAAATPGPWWNESGTVHAPLPFGRNDGKPGPACHPLDAQGRNGRDANADAEFASVAYNANPGLVAAVRAVLELADDDEAVAERATDYASKAVTLGKQDYWETLSQVRSQSADRIRAAVGAALGVETGAGQ
jgi:hypothetical protein